MQDTAKKGFQFELVHKCWYVAECTEFFIDKNQLTNWFGKSTKINYAAPFYPDGDL